LSRRRLRRSIGSNRSLFIDARAEPERFADLYVEYHQVVLAYFASRTLDPETAFDLMAETFAQAFTDIPQLRATTEEQGRAWLWAIARNQLFRWRERGRVERRCMQQLGIDRPEMSAIEFERTEELADLDRIRGEVEGALEQLGIEQREAVRLRVVDERGYSDIAARLGVSEQVVRARVSRGLRALAPVLADLASVGNESVP
jgi:RNA polymerase sigma factor (sigma-70 family)